ncbi:MAG: VOC family protein, partial [Candidatus Bathyarchaeota archaeon]
DLGRFFLCIGVSDIERSLDFYEGLGFKRVEGESGMGWTIIECGDLKLGLYKGKTGKNLINFLDAGVTKITKRLKKIGVNLEAQPVVLPDSRLITTIEDPDGNLITFAGVDESWVEPLKCPRCRALTEPGVKKFSFGVFEGRSYVCGACTRAFNAFYKDRKLSHTVPKSEKKKKKRARTGSKHSRTKGKH